MTEYVKSALFICPASDVELIERVQANPFDVAITSVEIDRFEQNPSTILNGSNHVVVSGGLDDVKRVLKLSIQYSFSVGLMPQEGYRELARSYGIPFEHDQALELALQKDGQEIDIVFCNEEILLYKATFGRLPLLDTSGGTSRLKIIWRALKNFPASNSCHFLFRQTMVSRSVLRRVVVC